MNNTNKEAILKHTVSYEEELLESLKDSEEAQAYLEAAFESYEQDRDTEALLLAMRDVAKAQGGVGELAKKTKISRQHLYYILSSKHNPRLDNWLSIISGLGFRVRLERQEVSAEHSAEHSPAHKG